ncbi:Response regulator receiver domain-containing protein [Sediminibacterium ginsengisoli]|uniref:Response regulator receiver domain-containing protein n=1 Tax=Sediminibacterium ginsengisoli TaxID=413434 RepID=A0A1T4QH25_9BACT|nr:Response regulator receiver domain-containing protein [Sediminibacterium ginsengisoli]
MGANKVKILLIDDSEFILQRLELLLGELEQVSEIRSAMSAEAGIPLLQVYKPDIIILDINLPGKNGLQMLKNDIRSLKNIHPLVIIFTNNTVSGYKAECLQYGADYFLDKARDFHVIPSIIEKTSREARHVQQS